MATSPARIAANRNNARRSTGPKTAAGKQASRGNALKHGLTGDGVVLPEIDVPAVAALEADLTTDLKPSCTLGRLMVRRMAVLAVRLQRCEQHGEAMTNRRVRDAADARAEERRAEVEAVADRLWSSPAETVRRLRETPEGIDRLIGDWRDLRSRLAPGREWQGRWDDPHVTFASLLGQEETDDPALIYCGRIITDPFHSPSVVSPFPDRPFADHPALARAWIVARIDPEIEALEALRLDVDDADEAADRNEAGVRALFDPTPDAERARRYESDTERGFFRALREFRAAEKEAAAIAEAVESAPPEPPAPPKPPAPAPAAPRPPQTNPTPAAPTGGYVAPCVHKPGDVPSVLLTQLPR